MLRIPAGMSALAALKAPARLVERARVVVAAPAGERAEAIAGRFHAAAATMSL